MPGLRTPNSEVGGWRLSNELRPQAHLPRRTALLVVEVLDLAPVHAARASRAGRGDGRRVHGLGHGKLGGLPGLHVIACAVARGGAVGVLLPGAVHRRTWTAALRHGGADPQLSDRRPESHAAPTIRTGPHRRSRRPTTVIPGLAGFQARRNQTCPSLPFASAPPPQPVQVRNGEGGRRALIDNRSTGGSCG